MTTLGIVGALAVGGCSSTPTQPEPQPPVQATSTLAPSTLKTPDAVPNLKILDQQAAGSGSSTAGSFFGHKGTVWIGFNCLGTGTATVIYSPVGSLNIPCGGAAVNSTRNQIYFPDDHQISLRVLAPAAVQWAVLVQE